MNKKVPVLFTIFNRKDVSLEAFRSIKQYHPDFLYISADGPRSYRKGESVICEETRKAVLDEIDWPCEIRTLFHKENRGCAHAMYEAITWFFQQEEYGIIIEDDIVVSQDFFHLCEVLLPAYIDVKSIMHINSQNYSFKVVRSNEYVFGKMSYCWGWATWAHAWRKMDMQMRQWKKFNKLILFKYFGFFNGLILWKYYWNTHRLINISNSWAVRWDFSILAANGICISPKVNLSKNVGICGTGGTHYSSEDSDPYENLVVGEIDWPLKLRERVEIDDNQLKIDNMDFTRLRLIGLQKKIRHLFRWL